MTDQKKPRPSLTARLDERFAVPLRNAAFAHRTWFAVTLAAIVVLHVAVVAFMLWRDREDPIQLAKVEETPVEIVVEQPQATPPPAPQPPATKQLIEKPATSAPRAQNDEKLEKDANDKETRAPKSETPKVEAPKAAAAPQPAPAEREAKADPATKDDAEPPKPDVLEKDAEALDKMPPEPPKKPAEFAKAKPPPPKPKPQRTAAQQLAGTSDLPDYTFAKPMKKRAKITGGSEDDRYLAVVFGMITQYHRPILAPEGEWMVAVAFQVDAHGTLVGIGIQHSSGYRSVDAAAIESVERAAPFPPPPSGQTTGLVARLHSDPRSAMMGER